MRFGKIEKWQSSKAAIKSMFETLRVELAPDIGVTIVTPGFVESELTQGKALNAFGKVELRQDMRDVSKFLNPFSKLIYGLESYKLKVEIKW